MPLAKRDHELRSWASVGGWIVFGTLVCIIVAVGFNVLFFSDLGEAALTRALISSTILPVVLGPPLLALLSLQVRRLAMANRQLDQLARTDSLTGCLNRGAFTAQVSEYLAHQPAPAGGALLMIDADNFKAINDLYGHDVGDDALLIIARCIRAVVRSGDLVGRMGGEEFCVYLPGADERAATEVAERIRRSIALAVLAPHGRRRALSVSVGGAVYERPACFTELFRIADQRLYGAKQSGRNRVMVINITDDPVITLKRSA